MIPTLSGLASYVTLKVEFDADSNMDIKTQLDQKMLSEWQCAGIEDLNLSEQELNQLLGDKAVTGGPLPEDVVDALESYAQNVSQQRTTYYFEGDNALDKALMAKSQMCLLFPHVYKISIHQLAEESWLEVWKKYYKPIEIDEDFVVLPSWYDAQTFTASQQIKIDPGQAFGTGSHESTRLCLTLLKKHFFLKPQLKIMDFGCGSGILALAALRLTKDSQAVLFDIDPAAYDNILVNASINAISADQFDLAPAALELSAPWSNQQYDLVMANILLPILLDKAHLLASLVNAQGHLLISGIMTDQWNELSEQLQKHGHWTVVAQASLNDWLAVLIQKVVH